ncbi:hypothetical protein FJT64_008668 [Amphibalanus amphitrite]|uniref:C-type lectin domain-containing protein n=1 Tax=Amphibalanus amphitrite TaxID=1232801 RepID=A0A6A4VPT3_AMPAM|nr:hypothetical protein FJT64_008668 [Amphibalanus amphitrite]
MRVSAAALVAALLSGGLCQRSFVYPRREAPAAPLEPLGAPLPAPSLTGCASHCGVQPRCAAFQLSGGLCRLFAPPAPTEEGSGGPLGPDPPPAPLPAGPLHLLTAASATYLYGGRRWRTTALLERALPRSAAVTACDSLRPTGHLPVIHSAEKNAHVRSVLTPSGRDGWLGMATADLPPYGFWDDHSPLDWTNWDGVTSPESPEPNGYAMNDTLPVDAAAMDPAGLWYDTSSRLENVPLCDQQLG